MMRRLGYNFLFYFGETYFAMDYLLPNVRTWLRSVIPTCQTYILFYFSYRAAVLSLARKRFRFLLKLPLEGKMKVN